MTKINNKDFLLNLDNLLENIPRRDYYFKDKIRNIAYEILNYILIINNSGDFLLIKKYFHIKKKELKQFF